MARARRIGYKDILSEKENVLKDNVLVSNLGERTRKKETKLRKLNEEAFKDLLMAMSCNTKRGGLPL